MSNKHVGSPIMYGYGQNSQVTQGRFQSPTPEQQVAFIADAARINFNKLRQIEVFFNNYIQELLVEFHQQSTIDVAIVSVSALRDELIKREHWNRTGQLTDYQTPKLAASDDLVLFPKRYTLQHFYARYADYRNAHQQMHSSDPVSHVIATVLQHVHITASEPGVSCVVLPKPKTLLNIIAPVLSNGQQVINNNN